jgi:hypothetical protein
LPPREPRTLLVHFLVDTAVAFLVTILLFLVFEIPLWVPILFSVGVGLGACRFTRNAEIEGLAKRRRDRDDWPTEG